MTPYKEDVSIVKELTDKRTKNSKYFLNSDNTVTVYSAAYSLHYKEGTGWKDIDTKIKSKGIGLAYTEEMNENRFKVRFGTNESPSTTIEMAGKAIIYKPLQINQ
ncbi:hypothetical protein [Paenibacillus elgii]|uniref:hypothetical protein n=1 Tax=Paenibacillus elgii TaxID=189691 RepID=UPI000FD838ED|nr:hypothetical protein [Paenibacillus elgii]NEN86182.1 hypothetical protein [Paenibacillus elgii]